MDINFQTFSIATSTAGAYDSSAHTTPGSLLMHVVYEAGGNLSTAAVVTLTDVNTGMTLFSRTAPSTAGFVATPRRPITDFDGVDSTSIYDYQGVTSRYKLTVASGGSEKAGTVHAVFAE